MTSIRAIVTDFDLDAVKDDWSALVSAGIAITDAHDRNRWTLGDLGIKVERRYKSDSLGKFASEIKVQPATMYDYVACSVFYDEERREAFPSLSWSHYRAAMKAGDPESAVGWLVRASDENWAVGVLSEAIRLASGEGKKPVKLVEFAGQLAVIHPCYSAFGELVGYELTFTASAELRETIAKKLVEGEEYTVKVFGTPKAETEESDAE